MVAKKDVLHWSTNIKKKILSERNAVQISPRAKIFMVLVFRWLLYFKLKTTFMKMVNLQKVHPCKGCHKTMIQFDLAMIIIDCFRLAPIRALLIYYDQNIQII